MSSNKGMSPSASDRVLFRDILRQVSRSFYLTIAVLPRAVRRQVGLAYLLARAADTIADSGRLDDATRMMTLRLLKETVQQKERTQECIQAIRHLEGSGGFSKDERRLLEEIGRCFSLLETFHPKDREDISRVLTVLIGGMEFDIERFPRNGEGNLHALDDVQDLEFYTYSVAGCVGEFWTRIMCGHLGGFDRWDPAVMIPLGIRFGKGLQMINILRDLPADLRKGRCYIPRTLLKTVGLSPAALLDETSFERFRPIYRTLLQEARDHLDQGWRYTVAIPRRQIRVRLACMWPILIGIQTLQRLSVSQKILHPDSNVKILRSDVYRIVATTGLTGGCGYVGNAYWGYWRKRIV